MQFKSEFQLKYESMLNQLAILQTKSPKKSLRGQRPDTPSSVSQQIAEVVRKRKLHESRIRQLTGIGDQISPRKRQNCLPQIPKFKSVLSISEVEQNVNFLASICQNEQVEQYPPPPNYTLSAQLRQTYPQYTVSLNHDLPTPQPMKQNKHAQIIRYLDENQLWEDLFTQSAKHLDVSYEGVVFQNGRYRTVCLSNEPLQKEEEAYLTVYEKGAGQESLNVKYVLLRRLLAHTRTQQLFLSSLQILFGYPYRTYSIQSTQEYLAFKASIRQIGKEQTNFTCYGYYQKSNSCEQISNIQAIAADQTKVTHLLRYDKLVLIQCQDLQIKQIELKCLANHHTVLTFAIPTAAQYIITLASPNPFTYFKVCLLNSCHKIVHFCSLQPHNSLFLELEADQYELCIYLERPSQELVQPFKLWVQGKQIHTQESNIELEIKLKEKYNTYTRLILTSYLQQLPKALSHEKEVRIYRTVTNCLSLCLDRITCPDFPETIRVVYSNTFALCDTHHNSKIVEFQYEGEPKEVCLRGDCDIQYVELGGTKVNFRMDRTHA